MDGIETEMGERARVVRVDIHGAAAEVVGRRYGISFTPTFVVFDESARERVRTSQPNVARDALRELVLAR